MLRRTLMTGLALLLVPGGAARAAEEDLSFITAIGAGLFMLVGGGLCFADDGEPEEYARDGLYLGLGGSYAFENFQQKGGATSLSRPLPGPTTTGPNPSLNAVIDPYLEPRLSDEGPTSRFGGIDDDAGATQSACGVRDQNSGAFLGPPCIWSSGPYARQIGGFPSDETGQITSAFRYEIRNYGVDEPGPWRVEDGDSAGINLRAGYRCHPRAAHEWHLEYLLDDFHMTGTTIGFATTEPNTPTQQDFVTRVRSVNSDLELWTTGVNTKLFLRKDRVQPYVLGGVGLMRVKEAGVRHNVSIGGVTVAPEFVDSTQFKDVDIMARIGGGIDYYATRNLVLSVESVYVRPTGRAEPYDYVSMSAGIQWRFDPIKLDE
jgi:opacity protein-like surface antigen